MDKLKDKHQLHLLTDEQLAELEKIRWKEYTPALVLEARAMLGRELAHLADDVAQEAIYQAVAAYGGYKESGYLKAWLKKITRRVAVTQYRTHTTRDLATGGKRPAAFVGLEALDGHAAETPDPDRELDGLILRRKVLTLSERPRTILLARVDAGFSFGDIGLSLGISRQAVHQHYRAAVAQLSAWMMEVNPAQVDKRRI